MASIDLQDDEFMEASESNIDILMEEEEEGECGENDFKFSFE